MSKEKVSYKFNEAVLKAMVELEGFTIEEAKLSYQGRKNLPANAFCGPNRTYPAHDAPHIRNALTRLKQFKPKGKKNILKCVCGRAKRAGVESDVCKKAGFQEAKMIKWYLDRHKGEISPEFLEALGPTDFKDLTLGQMMAKLKGWVKLRARLGKVYHKPSKNELDAVKLDSNIHSLKTAIGERMLANEKKEKPLDEGCNTC